MRRASSLEGSDGRAADAGGELHVLDHEGHAARVESAEVRVLEDCREVALGGFLEREDRLTLEPDATSARAACGARGALGDVSDKPLERVLGDDQLGLGLVGFDLLQGPLTGLKLLLDGLVLSRVDGA